MRIDGINNVNSIYKAKKSNKAYGSSEVSSSKDTLALSEFAKELQIANQAVKKVPDVRQARIDEIKQQMEAGSYNVQASQLAEKLLGKYFD